MRWAKGVPGVDLHTATGEYVYPHGPDRYGIGLVLCESSGEMTTNVRSSHLRSWNGRMQYICEWCATDEEVATSKSLRELNDERAPR